MYERILIPTDGSNVAEAAVGHALGIAEQYDTTIHALYVADTDSIAYGLGADQVDRIREGEFEEMDDLYEEANAATGSVATQCEERGLSVQEHHAGGKPHRMVAEYAEDNDIDLIVMGSHGRAGVRRALLGSVTERTLRSTHVPVLVVDYQGVEQTDTDASESERDADASESERDTDASESERDTDASESERDTDEPAE